jgi:hypothetical protein
MTHQTHEQRLSGEARRRFLAEERERAAEQRVQDEQKRQAKTTAKTARLREQRLAREAAEAAGAKFVDVGRPARSEAKEGREAMNRPVEDYIIGLKSQRENAAIGRLTVGSSVRVSLSFPSICLRLLLALRRH